MRALTFLVAAAAATGLRAAAPSVSNVAVTPVAGTDSLLVTYDLAGADGIVTFDVLTNGVSVGGANLTGVAGNINTKVASGEGRSFSWRPDKTWPASGLKVAAATVVVTAWATNAPPTYMVIDLGNGIKRFYPNKEQVPGGITSQTYKTTKLLMRKIPAAYVKWRMGSTSATDPNRQSDRENYHWVTLTADYYIAVYPITNRQFTYFPTTGTTWTYEGKSDDQPAYPVTWAAARGSQSNWPGGAPQATTALDNLAALSGIPTFDYPTEAQWEYACRAGTPSPFNGLTAGEVGWYGVAAPQPVGQKVPNAWDLYDMHGNVWEWCRDYYQATPYAVDSDVTDPEGPASGLYSYRAWRGGYFGSEAKRTSSSTRSGAPISGSSSINCGFRPVCDAVIP